MKTQYQITDNKAWKLCGKEGFAPPYAGYAKYLADGSFIRCVRPEVGKTYYELFTSLQANELIANPSSFK